MSKFGKLENWKIRKFGNEKMKKSLVRSSRGDTGK